MGGGKAMGETAMFRDLTKGNVAGLVLAAGYYYSGRWRTRKLLVDE